MLEVSQLAVARSGERRPIAGAFDFMVRGWRPAASWACVFILLMFGVVVPGFALARHEQPHLDLVLLGVLLAALRLSHDRTREKQEGLTS